MHFIRKSVPRSIKVGDNYVQLSIFDVQSAVPLAMAPPLMIYKGLKKVEMSKTQKMRVVNIFLAAGAVVAQEEESTTIGLDLSDFERGRNKKKQQVKF